MANSKMSYATGYLLKISKDAMFDSPTRVSRSLATIPSGSPFSNRTASPIKLKFGRRSPTSPLQDLWYATEAMISLMHFEHMCVYVWNSKVVSYPMWVASLSRIVPLTCVCLVNLKVVCISSVSSLSPIVYHFFASSRGDGWEDHSENNQQDTASVVAALAKSRCGC